MSAPGAPNAPAPYTAPALNKSEPAQYQLKNLWSAVLYPGYVIDKNRLAYAKIGYTGVTIGLNSASAPYQTNNLSGMIFGLGYKQMITESIYILGEANYGTFSTKNTQITSSNGTLSSSIGGNGYDFLVGLGYRF